MKKVFLAAAVICLLLLIGCGQQPPAPTDTTPTPDPDQTVQSQPDPPQHSPLYIPGLDVEEVLLYFNEVCLDAEISHSGDSSRLQKWVTPIYYRFSGEYTHEDTAIFTSFADWLNTVEGFPGIREARNDAQVNLRIYFCPQSEMASIMGDWACDLDGAVTFWFSNHEIYDATICYRTDVDQQIRNSVILEELYNGLGPIQDTDRRADSIIYSGYSTPQSLTAVDELLLRLLYHPQLLCGMDPAQCETVIRHLYY